MNTYRRPRSGLFALAGVAIAAIVMACGGDAADDTPAPAATTAPAGAATDAGADAGAAVATSPATPAAGSQPAGDDPADELAIGREIFNSTAGGVGCAYCHGADGKGDGPAMVGAPANRGATEAMVRDALNNVALMSEIKLTNDEIKAVVAYLAYLAEQP